MRYRMRYLSTDFCGFVASQTRVKWDVTEPRCLTTHIYTNAAVFGSVKDAVRWAAEHIPEAMVVAASDIRVNLVPTVYIEEIVP